jgi:Tfp pilus assembly protein PilF
MYEQALAARNDDPRILFSLGMAFVQQGKTAAAQEKLEQARALGFKNPALSMRLGTIYLNQSATEKAVQAFTEVLEMDARAVLPHVYLAQIYSQKRLDKRQALYHLRKVLEIDPRIPQADTIRAEIQRLEKETN